MCGWSIVWISRMKLRATPIATPGRMSISDHSEQGAERCPELERLRAPVLRELAGVDHAGDGPDHDRAEDRFRQVGEPARRERGW